MGGATEASIWSNWFEVTHVNPQWRSIPYGFPLSNQAYHVLDSHLNPCPNWVRGDLYIAGTGLALGYENDPQTTKRAFILSQHGERLYKTGDMACYWSNGTLEFLGRKDTQVKISGHRIELGEIEAALLTHPHIQEAAVESTGDLGAQRLIGWIKLTEETPLFHVKHTADPKESEAQSLLFQNGLPLSLASLHIPLHILKAITDIEEKLATACLRDIFRSAGLFTGKDERKTEQCIAALLEFHEEFRSLLPRWLAHLERKGELSHEHDLWWGHLAPADWESLEKDIQNTLPAPHLAFFKDLRHKIVPSILPIIRNEMDPLQLFYKEEEEELTPNALSRLHPCIAPLQKDLGALISQTSHVIGRPLRVLEVGSRFAQDTLAWLQETASEVKHLVLSDPSYLLLENVQESVKKEYPHLSYESWVFDPDTTAVEDHRKGSCDLIFALSGFHRCKNLPKALSALKTLLAPGGTLLFVEFTQTPPMLNLTTALIERGYEKLSDFRQGRGTPLLSQEEWFSTLSRAGFLDIQSYIADHAEDIQIFRAHRGDTVSQFAEEKVSAYLKNHLPDYMIPRHFMVLENFPLSANGKVDRKRLPKFLGTSPQTGGTTFTTGSEEKMAAVWNQFLPDPVLDRESNFFTAGGDSLTAVRMLDSLRSVFQRSITLRDIFAHPVLWALASHIDQKAPSEAEIEPALPRLEINQDQRFEPFPLTDVQQAYWVGHQPIFPLSGISAHYYFELDITGHTLPGLNTAWNHLVVRHEMLRAVIDTDGQQRILPHVPTIAFPSVDLSSGDETALEFWLTRQRKEMDHKIYDTAVWPLFEIRAAQLQDRIRLLVSLDTVICDARSLVMLLSEWSLLSHNPDAVLPPLELSFRDIVLHWKKEESSHAFSESLAYWRQKLPELPSGPNLRLVKAPEDVFPVRFQRQTDSLPSETWSSLQDQAARHGLSPNAILLAVYGLCLRAGGGGNFFSLNLTLFRRDTALHPQTNCLVGDFTSLLLLPFDGRTQSSFNALAQNLQLTLGEGLDHMRVSAVRVIQEAFGQKQNINAPVVFTSNLGVDRTATDGHTQDWLGTFVGGLTQTPQVWLDLQVIERDNTLLIYWDYVEALFEPAWVQHLCKAYSRLLHRLAEEPESWNAPWSTLVEFFPLPGSLCTDDLWMSFPEENVSETKRETLLPSHLQIEALVTQALAAELHHGPLNPNKNFFELGATSLTLIRMYQNLKETLDMSFPITTLFEHTSIHALSTHLSQSMEKSPEETGKTKERREIGDTLTAQRRRALRHA
jgi:acyl carrier protein/SAM-dependent methyltransferase